MASILAISMTFLFVGCSEIESLIPDIGPEMTALEYWNIDAKNLLKEICENNNENLKIKAEKLKQDYLLITYTSPQDEEEGYEEAVSLSLLLSNYTKDKVDEYCL